MSAIEATKARLLEIEACLNDVEYIEFIDLLTQERMLLLQTMMLLRRSDELLKQAKELRLTINKNVK